MSLAAAIAALRDSASVQASDMDAAFAEIMDGVAAHDDIKQFLTLTMPLMSHAPLIAAGARALRSRMVSIAAPDGAIDVCGTGGDGAHTLNISTAVAFVVAGCGVPVAKHGNRAVTSRAGSADVLEALGIRIELTPEEAADWLRTRDFAFFFAPRFHPVIRHLAPARKLCAQRGQRTVFNLLGPLLNPAQPDVQLVGVPRPEWCEPIARVLQSLGVRRAMVVCGRAGAGYLDELSTVGETVVAEFHHERGLAVSTLQPQSFPVQPVTLRDLEGGDRETNANVVQQLLGGVERGPKRDAVLLNAGAALFLAGRARSLTEGWSVAEDALDSGRAAVKLAQLQQAR